MLSPELVDQAIAREDMVCVHQEEREQRALLRTRQRQRLVPVANLQRAEYPVLHRTSCRRLFSALLQLV